MATGDYMTVSQLAVMGLVGDALQIPPALWEPGTLSAHKGHFGQGATASPFTASLVIGPSLTSPLSINTIGMEQLTGLRNVFGSDIKIGSDLKLGAADLSYSGIGNDLNALYGEINPENFKISPDIGLTSFSGALIGFWTLNGLPISTEPDVTSDARLKKNIEPFQNGLEIILELNPVRFDWREDKCSDSFLNEYRGPEDEYGYPGEIKRQYGLIAQEVEKVIPDVVGERKMYDETYKLIRYEKIVPILISAIQDQQKQIEDLKNEIDSLKQIVNNLINKA